MLTNQFVRYSFFRICIFLRMCKDTSFIYNQQQKRKKFFPKMFTFFISVFQHPCFDTENISGKAFLQ